MSGEGRWRSILGGVTMIARLLINIFRFTQSGEGRWRSILGGVTMIARLFSLLTINLFLPPSQLIVHPFLR